jgi:hypothetical protein
MIRRERRGQGGRRGRRKKEEEEERSHTRENGSVFLNLITRFLDTKALLYGSGRS